MDLPFDNDQHGKFHYFLVGIMPIDHRLAWRYDFGENGLSGLQRGLTLMSFRVTGDVVTVVHAVALKLLSLRPSCLARRT